MKVTVFYVDAFFREGGLSFRYKNEGCIIELKYKYHLARPVLRRARGNKIHHNKAIVILTIKLISR